MREWSRFQDAPLGIKGLDRALGAFDMFVLHDQHGDMDEIAQTLDDLAARFRAEHAAGGSSDPDRAFDELSTRDKAVALVRWVRANSLAGMDDPPANYRNLRNCLIGQALCDPSHPSLPIISSAIYCCLAERVGLMAACCAFPSHVHAAVFAPPGRDLDGQPSAREGGTTEKMFLDPYGCDDEVTVRDLRERLAEFGWLSDGGDVFLTASPAAVIVQRTAQNIKSTYVAAQHPQNGGAGEGGRELLALRAGDPELNLQAAVYAALWAGLLITPASSFHWDDNLGGFLTLFAKHFSEDAWIVERHLLPLYDAFVNATPPNPHHAHHAHHHAHVQQEQQAGGEAQAQQRRGWENVHEALAIARNLDARRPAAQRRYTQDIRDAVRHRVGQVFRHRRYGYVAIINGWAVGGVGSLPTPNTMSMQETLDQIEDTGGAHQSRQAAGPGAGTAEAVAFKPAFYTCLCVRYPLPSYYVMSVQHADDPGASCRRATVDRHVVAQANVEIITDPALIPEELFFLAGKFFKRFDRETCTFVSNVKEFYPDD